MEAELQELKKILMAVVVSSRKELDLQGLLRDYQQLLGEDIPLEKFGFSDPLQFLKEQCTDCFKFDETSTNPILTLIMPKSLEYIDKLVQRLRDSSGNRREYEGERKSITPPDANSSRAVCKHLVYHTFYKTPILPRSQNLQHSTADTTPQQSSESSFEMDATSDKDEKDDVRETTFRSGEYERLLHFYWHQTKLFKSDIMAIIADAPEGIWCSHLTRMYRARYGHHLNYSIYGFNSLINVVFSLVDVVHVTLDDGRHDWHLLHRRYWYTLPAPPSVRLSGRRLLGVDYDPEVFPADSMQLFENIPRSPMDDFFAGALLQVAVTEVYSPSHFWLIRLGEQYDIAMENIMADMTRYFSEGEGQNRFLARGAVRVGLYCCAVYHDKCHRALIVKIIDSETVKVRYVDYGTVEKVSSADLRPLLRCWATLPAQAVRACLATVRPTAGARRWPRIAAQYFVRLVWNRPFVGHVLAVDAEEEVVELLLIDTSTPVEVLVTNELVRTFHAESRHDPVLQTGECYLYPKFEAIETGETPNFEDIHNYMRDGISLDSVEAYRRYVPALDAVEPFDFHFGDNN